MVNDRHSDIGLAERANTGFDDFVDAQCAGFYAETMGRSGLPLGLYFRLLLIGYFEGGLVGIARLSGRRVGPGAADHSTISRTRRLIALETHRAGMDATTLEANVALRSIVRRDSGESYEGFLITLAGRIWRTRPNTAIDLDTGAIVGITVQGADKGDTTTIQETLPEAAEQLEAVAAVEALARRVGSGERACVNTRTCSNDCFFTPARSIRAASRAALSRSVG